jgi:hypothetical protein
MRRNRLWTEEWHERVFDPAQASLSRDHCAQGKDRADDIAATAEPEVVRVIAKGGGNAGGGNLVGGPAGNGQVIEPVTPLPSASQQNEMDNGGDEDEDSGSRSRCRTSRSGTGGSARAARGMAAMTMKGIDDGPVPSIGLAAVCAMDIKPEKERWLLHLFNYCRHKDSGTTGLPNPWSSRWGQVRLCARPRC